MSCMRWAILFAAASTLAACYRGDAPATVPADGATAGAAVNTVDTRSATPVPALGAHTLLWQEQHHGDNPAVTQAIATQPEGSSFLVFNAGYRENTDAPTDSKANAWASVGSPVVYDGYGGRFDIKAYVAVDGVGGAGHTVRILKRGPANGEITVPFIEIKHAAVLQDVAHNYPAAAPALTRTLIDAVWPFHQEPSSADRSRGVRSLADVFRVAVTSESVTTTGPATLIAVWFGDAYAYDMVAIPGNGFTVIDSLLHLPPDSAVQCAVAYRDVAEAGTYRVTWTETPNQGAALWLFAFQSGASAGEREPAVAAAVRRRP